MTTIDGWYRFQLETTMATLSRLMELFDNDSKAYKDIASVRYDLYGQIQLMDYVEYGECF